MKVRAVTLNEAEVITILQEYLSKQGLACVESKNWNIVQQDNGNIELYIHPESD